MLRFATIGTSNITREFLSAAKLCDAVEPVAVYSRNPENGRKFAAEFGIKHVFDDIEVMAKSDLIDAVYIASVNSCHKEQSEIFIKNGKSVLCEKPIVTSSDDFKTLFELSKNSGVIYSEAIMSRHNTAARKKLLDAISEIGDIRMARINYCQRSSRLDSFLSGKHVNIFDMSLYAGCLMDLGVYCVYSAIDLLGAPKNVEFASKNLLNNGADGSGIAVLDYGKYKAVLTYSKIGQSSSKSEIIGDKGAVTIDSVSQYTGICLHKNGNETEIFGTPSKIEVMKGEIIDFADYVNGNNSDDYYSATSLCFDVHKTMDAIKQKANINYNVGGII